MTRRNKHIFTTFLVFILLISFVGTSYAQKKPKDKFDFPELNKIKMPKVKKVTLKNGLKLFLVEDHKYPTINMRAMIHAGSMYEPIKKIGLASVTGTVLRTGGTKKMPGDEIDKQLETMAASIETGLYQTSGAVNVSMLKEHVDRVLPILADILQNPVFNKDKIKLAKIEQKTIISRRNDNIMAIANREFFKLIYGAKSPYGRNTEYATIDAITRKDIVAFYEKYVHPNNMIMAIWGDFKTSQMVRKIKKTLGKWKSKPLKLAPIPQVKYDFKYTVNFIDKPDVNQSNIMMGHIGGKMNNPDIPSLMVMNRILSFDRMFKKIRTDEGLAYSIWGSYGAQYSIPGVFSAGAQTKSKTTVYAIKLMLKEMKRIQKEEVTDKEIKRAKDQYLNTFVFQFDSKAKIINRMMTYVFFKYPLNFTEQLMKKVEKVTKADVLRVAKKYIRPDKVQILVVGKKKDFDEPLSTLGNVNVIDITIPVPKGEEGPKATAESLEKGKKIFEKSIAAIGDPQKIKNIKNVSFKMDLTQVTPMGEMKMAAEGIIEYPDKVWFSIMTPGGQIQMIVNGKKSIMKHPGGSMPLPEAQKKSTITNILRDPVYVYQNLDKYKIQFIGKKKFNEKNTIDILLSGPVDPFHMYLDPDTLLPAGGSHQGMTQAGPAKMEETTSDYRDVDGIKVAFKTIGKANGKKASETIMKEMKFNVKIKEGQFKTE